MKKWHIFIGVNKLAEGLGLLASNFGSRRAVFVANLLCTVSATYVFRFFRQICAKCSLAIIQVCDAVSTAWNVLCGSVFCDGKSDAVSGRWCTLVTDGYCSKSRSTDLKSKSRGLPVVLFFNWSDHRCITIQIDTGKSLTSN